MYINSFVLQHHIAMVTATTTVARDAHYYDMNHNNQGFAYIFSHDQFSSSQKRNASEVDEKKLQICLSKLGFDVQLFKDLKVAEIEYQIYEGKCFAFKSINNHK